MISWDRVAELKNDLGPDGFEEVVQSFLDEMDERFEVMRDASGRDWGADLHFIRGCSANLGFTELSTQCQDSKIGGPQSFSEIEACYKASRATFLAEK